MTDREMLELLLKEVTGMKNDLIVVKADVKGIKLTLENEIRPNIQGVA